MRPKPSLACRSHIVLGFTGFVREWNGLDRVLDLLATRKRPNGSCLSLAMVRRARHWRSGARTLGVAGRLRFTGVVEAADMATLVSAFDVALQPAANAYASPLKLFEYMALAGRSSRLTSPISARSCPTERTRCSSTRPTRRAWAGACTA